MRTFALPILLCLGLAAPTSATSDVFLWSTEIHKTGGIIGVANTLSPRIEIRDPNAPSPVALATLFAWLNLNASNSGMTYSANSATDADWPFFNAYVTDGAPNLMRIFLRLSSGSGTGYSFTGPEFPGLIVTRADLVLGTVSVVSPGSNPNGDGNWTDYVFNARLELYGTGPTPAAGLSWGRLKTLYR